MSPTTFHGLHHPLSVRNKPLKLRNLSGETYHSVPPLRSTSSIGKIVSNTFTLEFSEINNHMCSE